MVVSHSVISLV